MKLPKSILFYVFLLFSNISLLFSQAYQFETKVSGLNVPTCFEFFPNGNVIINQKNGASVIYTLNNTLVSTFWNFGDSLNNSGECGLIGVCLDPVYNTNQYIYFYYITNTGHYRVVRLTNTNNTGTSPLILFDQSGLSAIIHVAGNLHFGRDNKLYISIGENNLSSNSQSLSTFKGKILRINKDGSIPSDNPFYDDGNPSIGNDDRIWVLGLRNSYDFIFSPFNDSLYATENMQGSPDEVNYITKGKNYGWPVCQGYCNPFNQLYKQPLDTIFGSGAQNFAPTGILIYNGNIMPELYGKMIYCGVGSGPIKGIIKAELGRPPLYDTIMNHSIINPTNLFLCIKQGMDGYIYLSNSLGLIQKMVYNTTGITDPEIPRRYILQQNYPNPFNPVTKIKYSLQRESRVTLNIYDIEGREISILADGYKSPGEYEVSWDAENFPSGVYFYRLTAGNFSEEKKMVLLK